MNPKPINIGPKRLCGRRRYQYKPATTGPRMKSAFCAASQPGYVKKSAESVTHTAAVDAATAARRTVPCHNRLSRPIRLIAAPVALKANGAAGPKAAEPR